DATRGTVYNDYIYPHFLVEVEFAPGVVGVASVLRAIDEAHDAYVAQLPSQLPAEHVEAMLALMDHQIASLETSMLLETRVPACQPNVCTLATLGVLPHQRRAMHSLAQSIEDAEEFAWQMTVHEIGVFVGFGVVKIAGLLSAVLAVPSEAVIWGGAATIATIPSILGTVATVDALTNRQAMTKISLDAVAQLANDLQARRTVFETTGALLVEPPPYLENLLQASGIGAVVREATLPSEILTVEVPDILLQEDQTVGQEIARVALANTGSTTIHASAYANIVTMLNGQMRTVTLAGAPPLEIAPGTEGIVEVPYGVSRSSLVNGSGYDMHLNVILSGGQGQLDVRGPMVHHFFAGTEEQLRVLRNQQFTVLAAGSLETGESYTAPVLFSLPSGTSRLVLSFPDASDHDLHLFDASGRHVGQNYRTGQVEIEIPGTSYSGSDAWPEWMELKNPGGEAYEVLVVARSSRAGGSYSLSMLEAPELSAILDSSPQVEWHTVRAPGGSASGSFGLLVKEGSGSQQLTDLQVIPSDFTEESGAILPASEISIASPSELGAGASALVILRFTVGSEVPDGFYAGHVQITAREPGGGLLTSTSRVSLIIASASQRPRAEAGGPYAANEGDLLLVNGADSSDPDGEPLRYRWDFNGDGTWDTELSSDPSAAFPSLDDFVGEAVLQVLDTGALSDVDAASVVILNVPPLVEVGPDVTILHEESFMGGGAFADPGLADTHTILWDFGDGSTASDTLTPAHVYSGPGTYTVSLVVTDDDEGVGMDSLQVKVVLPEPPTAPEPLAPEDGATLEPGPATLTVRNAVSPYGAEVQYVFELYQDDVLLYASGLIESGASETSWQTPELRPGNFDWRVRAVDARGLEGPWSQSRTFHVSCPYVFVERFDPYGPQANPEGWVDYRIRGHHFVPRDGFRTAWEGGDILYRSHASRVASEYRTEASLGWHDYEWSGRFVFHDDRTHGVGLLVYADLKTAKLYQVLFDRDDDRDDKKKGFRALKGFRDRLTGLTDSGFVPDDDQWYGFRIRVENKAKGTRIRARFWAFGSEEPPAWQIDAVDIASPLNAGGIGVLAGESGLEVDDLRVEALGGPASGISGDRDGDGVCDEADDCPHRPNTAPFGTDADGVGDACDACTARAARQEICLDAEYEPASGLGESVLWLEGDARHSSGGGICGEPGAYRLRGGGAVVFETGLIAEEGRYRLQFRVRASASHEATGLNLEIEGEPFIVPLSRAHSGEPWQWTKPITVELSAGTHRMRVGASGNQKVDIEKARIEEACQEEPDSDTCSAESERCSQVR
ncbi:MAG TPA: PKD domain-containing protein, partial [Thermoleophilia bacterium]|nr:PKD domain-containing protein [Thermoleophilia bacterium]